MSSRHSAARPKRAGEAFARVHHGERRLDEDGSTAKKVKFDVRNPSALAADAREEDDVLDADVIGMGGGLATKRGAVNIDGYDSDSDNETFEARASAKWFSSGGDNHVNILDQLDNYDSRLRKGEPLNGAAGAGAGNDDGDDMFAEDVSVQIDPSGPAPGGLRKKKGVHFLEQSAIEGQEQTSKSGGTVRLDDEASSDDEDDVGLAIEEEGIDEEVGAGGLKRHAPRIDAFNMRQEQEEGAFDEAGNFIRKAADADGVHDRWLDGIKKKDVKNAAAAHEKREADLRQLRKEEDSILTSDLIRALLLHLEKAETPLEALVRLGKAQAKPKTKKVPKWRVKKQGRPPEDGAGSIAVDAETDATDPTSAHVKSKIGAITEAADRLLGRDYPDIYETEREMLIREYRNETGEDWIETSRGGDDEAKRETGAHAMEEKTTAQWEFRWTDGRDGGAKQGPFDASAMQAWHAAGYFGEGVEFRRAGTVDDWTRVAAFLG